MKPKHKVGARVHHVARKTVERTGPHVAKVARGGAKVVRKTAHHTKRVYKKAHYHAAERPHAYAMSKWAWYARWHNWRWHKLVHGAVTVSYLLVVGVVIFNVCNTPVAALSTWAQTNWGGGVGTSTANQYSAVSNIDTSSANQLTLSKTSNAFGNNTFDSNVAGWNGYGKAYDSSRSYSASGSAKITAGAVSSAAFYSQLTTTGVASQGLTASGDINGDGLDDIAVSTWVSSTSNEVRWYPSNGDGTYGAATVLTTPTLGSYDLVMGDFTGDGWNDLIVTQNNAPTGSSLKVAFFANTGAGAFSAPSEIVITGGPTGGARTCTIDKGYIDGNASLDFVVVCVNTLNIFVFLNNGSGTFTQSSYPVGYSASTSNLQKFTLVDINNDERPELVDVLSGSGCVIAVLPNNGSGFDASTTYTLDQCGSSGATKYAISGGDLNGDGYGDIVIGRRSGTGGTSSGDTYYATVMFGTSSNTLTGQANYTGSTGTDDAGSEIIIEDIDKDGFPEIMQALFTNSVMGYYKNNGDGTFATKVDYPTGTSPYGITSTDTNGDGYSDIVAVNSATTTFSTFINRIPGEAITQKVNVGDTNTYQLEAYAYTSGAAVTSADVELWANGAIVPTTYAASATPGWYRLTGTVVGANEKRDYGAVAKQGKTVYLDNANLYRYANSGTLTSAIFDPGFGGAWDAAAYVLAAGSASVKIRTSNNSDMSGATDFSSCSAIVSGADISSNGCVTDGHRYVQYQIGLAVSSGATPVLTSFSLQYDAFDVIAPDTNASNIAMTKASGGSAVAEGGWTNGASPYFSWTAGEDNSGGSGLVGYCVYLGQTSSADPHTTKGILGTSPVASDACPFVVSGTELNLGTAGLLGSALATSNSSYYLNIRALDAAGNVYGGSAESFGFKFDNVAPSNPAFLSAPSQYVNTKIVGVSWPTSGGDAASDANSGIAGLQYQIGSTGWYGDDHTGTGGDDDLLNNDGNYTTTGPDIGHLTDGVNIMYLRTWDQAGNITTTYVSAALKINTSSAPSAPQGVGASPATNTANSFAFSWSAPDTYSGDANNLSYCYTINALPNVNNCTFTAPGATSLSASSFATQPDENTFYVVAKDEAGNINYSNHATASFYANTPAPGIPVNVSIADVSVKSNSNWRLAVTWDEPQFTGAGISRYKIFRSTDNTNFSEIGTSSETSYVNTGLSQTEYYYKVRACDSANQCSALSTVASETPTGKFTSPAAIVSAPVVSGVTTKRATINWSTDRTSDSKVAIGTASGSYSPSEIGNSTQTTAHEIELDNLAAGTTYYFKAKWTDEDGNTGQSQEYVFTTAPAPVLKEVDTLSVGLSNAVIQFTTKDSVKARINFGKSDAFGGEKTLNTSAAESTYELALEGLDDGTKYFYRITMFDSEGGSYNSSIFSFTTPQRPRINNLRFQPVAGEPTSTQQITWETNVPTNSIVDYGIVGSNSLSSQTQELKTSHDITIRGLQDDSEYFLIAQGRDASGNVAVSDKQIFKTALDTRPPQISEVAIEASVRGTGAEARGQIVVSWKTDEPSTSQVAFGEGSSVSTFNNKTAEDGQLTTEHLVIVSDLPPSKVYSIAPVSKDKAGNQVQAKSQSAIIGRASDGVLNIVLNTLKKVFGL